MKIDKKARGRVPQGQIRVEMGDGQGLLHAELSVGADKHGDEATGDTDHRVLIQQQCPEEVCLVARATNDPNHEVN